MPQILMVNNKKLDVDRSFADGGSPPKYAMIGGERVLIAEGSPPRPEIYQRGNSFFYGDGTPVVRPEDVEWLPEPSRTKALECISGLLHSQIRRGRPRKHNDPTHIRPLVRGPKRKISLRGVDALGPEALRPARPE